MAENKLYYGDNLDILRRYVKDESVDLVYLDPPFKSDRNYNVLFAERDGSRAAAQIRAFEDTWTWDVTAAAAYQEIVEAGGRASQAMQAFRALLGDSDMLAYLAMMAPRLVELRRVLKPTGSLYLHCDPTASHYLKLLLDAAFGPERFVGEITWQRTNVHSDAKRWSPVADSLLFYAKTDNFTWNPAYAPHDPAYIATKYRFVDANGRRYRLDNMTSPNPRPNMMYEWKGHASPPMGWRYSRETMARLDAEGRIWYPDSKEKRPQFKRYLDETPGLVIGNVWTDIDPINSQADERLGYPTQKPQALLERIIQASSNEGDVVLDPFCGCGTTIGAAQALGRRWIGIDITHLAIGLIRSRLSDAFGPEIKGAYEVVGEPVSLEDAKALADLDRYQFQFWALGLVNARPAARDEKRGADKGIDGRLYFHDEAERTGKTKQIVLSVKSGAVQSRDVRDLCAVVDREHAQIGALLTLEEPTRDMRKEAAGAGFYELPGRGRFPKIQLRTIGELLEGKELEYPHWRSNVTFRRAPKAEARPVEDAQGALPLMGDPTGDDGPAEPAPRSKPAKRSPLKASKLS